MTFQILAFLICDQLMRHEFVELFHLSDLLQMLNDCEMALFSAAGSPVVVRGSALIIALTWSLLTTH